GDGRHRQSARCRPSLGHVIALPLGPLTERATMPPCLDRRKAESAYVAQGSSLCACARHRLEPCATAESTKPIAPVPFDTPAQAFTMRQDGETAEMPLV